MEKSRLNAYLDLIQKLLTCPHGEEWIHLKQHEALVDAEFLQFMEQIAIQIEREGDRHSATFLHNWAAKLHHILLKEIKPLEPEEDKSEDYFDLIEQLLACPEGREEQLLIAHETLIGPGLVNALHNVSNQLRERDENAAAQYLESIATDLSQAWLKEYDLPSPLQKKALTSASRSPAPYSQSYGIAGATPELRQSTVIPTTPLPTPIPLPVASTQAMASAGDEIEDPWLSPGETATLPMTVPASIPYPFQPSQVQTEPRTAPKNSHPEQLPPEHLPSGYFSEQAHSVNTVAQTSPTEPVSHTASVPSNQQVIADGLNAIAQALQQLNQTLHAQQAPHPLHHLETLEKACQANWQLTTEELERLLGVRPKCHGNEAIYRRGEWCFTKVGKLGNQTAWRVTKEKNS